MSCLGRLLAWPFRWWARRLADQIDRDHPGPHLPGTLGAEWQSFAEKLRAL